MSEVTFEPFQKVLVRDCNDAMWDIDFFRFFNSMSQYSYYCFRDKWKMCLPFNDETKHLLGTTDSPTPPEPEFQWGDHVEVRDEEIQIWLPAIYTGRNDRGVYALRKDKPLVEYWKQCRHADW